jgi:small subunit ribosomal protein S9
VQATQPAANMFTALRQPLRPTAGRQWHALVTAFNPALSSSYASLATSSNSGGRDTDGNQHRNNGKSQAQRSDDGRDGSGRSMEKNKPASQAFYTNHSEFFDQLETLQEANRYARRALTLLELLPVPAFARSSVPSVHSFWKNRAELSDVFEVPLKMRHYTQLIRVLDNLNQYQNIARVAGHAEIADNISHVVRLYERNNKEDMTSRTIRDLARFDHYGRTYSVGKRKESSARVWMIPVLEEKTTPAADTSADTAKLEKQLFKGESTDNDVTPTTNILVNGRPLRDFFASTIDRERIVRSLKLAGVIGRYNVFALVRGGGTTGQSGAISLAIAKGLATHEPDVREMLRKGKPSVMSQRCLLTKSYSETLTS